MIREFTETEKSVVTLWLASKGVLGKGALFAQDTITFMDRKVALVRTSQSGGRSGFRLTGMPLDKTVPLGEGSVWKATFDTTFIEAGWRIFSEAHIFDFDTGETDVGFRRDVMLWLMLNPID